MLLTLDIGNTSILLGVYEGTKLVGIARLDSDADRLSGEYRKDIEEALVSLKIGTGQIEGVIISSVVPALNPVFKSLCEQLFKIEPLFIDAGLDTGIKLACDDPSEVGADRIAVCVAASGLYGKPLIVVDFGTAVTYDVIGEEGEYMGGVISPGMEVSLKALIDRTALLPSVDIEKPGRVVGRNTVNCMQSGIVYGFLGQVKEIVTRIKEEIKGNPAVIATGGYAETVAGDLPLIDKVHPNLILEGLRMIWERNQNT